MPENVFRIQEELVPPNGSGDTTWNYIQVFTGFVLALLILVPQVAMWLPSLSK